MDAEAYADMLPWIVFFVIDRKTGLGVAWAGGSALVCSAGLAVWAYWRGRCSLLPKVAVALFAACLVSGLLSHAWNEQVSLPRSIVMGSMSILAFGSLRFTPLSEAYTVPLVAPSVRDDPRFTKVNVEITLAWAVGSLAVTIAAMTAKLFPGDVEVTIFGWVVPVVLATLTILWAARRWELFRLAVDSVAVGSGAARQPFDVGAPAGSGLHELLSARTTRARGVHALGAAGAERPGGLEGGTEGSSDAVIRELPLRSKNA